jgi:fatty-acyl-CoA synthase
LGERRVGDIEVTGASVVRGYWGELPGPADGWLRTGDLGYLAEGELVVCGRTKDVLFAAGRNIFPPDVEAAAAVVSGVRPGGVAAFGVAAGPSAYGDRLVVAVETRQRDRDAVRRGVAAAVLDEVGLAPDVVLTVPFGRLPKTSSGKLRRAEARRRYLSGQLAQGERTTR